MNDYEVINERRQKQAIELIKSIDRKVLTESESKQILSLYDIPISRECSVLSEFEAIQVAEKIGYPIVMKVDSSDILHKTDAGGVRIGLQNKEEVIQAYHDILKKVKHYKPDAGIKGILIQEMITGGTEVIIGVTRDEQFGATIMFGIGGIFVEIFKDSVFYMPPLSRDDAITMIKSIKGYPVLMGARGQKPKDVHALADTLLKISQMVIELQEYILEMDINPLLVMGERDGVKAVDGLIVLR